MLEAVVLSGSLVKSQQIGEAELTPEECREELLHQFRSRPLVFLERYHVCEHSSMFCFADTSLYKGWYFRCIKIYSQSIMIKYKQAVNASEVLCIMKPMFPYLFYHELPHLPLLETPRSLGTGSGSLKYSEKTSLYDHASCSPVKRSVKDSPHF